jgi:hypothetical protein
VASVALHFTDASQAPPLQKVVQTRPQTPQFCGSVSSAKHPAAGPQQLSPAAQATQLGPQWSTASQGLHALPSQYSPGGQSAGPRHSTQLPPAKQRGVVPPQAWQVGPQCASSLQALQLAPSQYCCAAQMKQLGPQQPAQPLPSQTLPAGQVTQLGPQCASVLHGAQLPAWQYVPAGQSVWFKQVTHFPATPSQRGVVPPQRTQATPQCPSIWHGAQVPC